jgi:hypothetical protein
MHKKKEVRNLGLTASINDWVEQEVALSGARCDGGLCEEAWLWSYCLSLIPMVQSILVLSVPLPADSNQPTPFVIFHHQKIKSHGGQSP